MDGQLGKATGKGDAANQVKEFISTAAAVRPLLIMSYECYRIHATALNACKEVGLLVCDEAHRLKSGTESKTMTALAASPARARLLLTGTPVQNDLLEFYSLVGAGFPSCVPPPGPDPDHPTHHKHTLTPTPIHTPTGQLREPRRAGPPGQVPLGVRHAHRQEPRPARLGHREGVRRRALPRAHGRGQGLCVFLGLSLVSPSFPVFCVGYLQTTLPRPTNTPTHNTHPPNRPHRASSSAAQRPRSCGR